MLQLIASKAHRHLIFTCLALLLAGGFSSVAMAANEVSGPYQPYKPPVVPSKPAAEIFSNQSQQMPPNPQQRNSKQSLQRLKKFKLANHLLLPYR